METNKESSFVREIENRLNVLFGEDSDKPDSPKATESKSGRDRLEEIVMEPHDEGGDLATEPPEPTDSSSEPLHEHDSLKEISTEPQIEPDTGQEAEGDLSSGKIVGAAKDSDFVREIEDRLSTLLSVEEGHDQPEHSTSSHLDLQEIVSSPEERQEDQQQKEGRFEAFYGDMDESASIMYSPLKELKSIVLSIEWEISDPILEKFDHEINRLHELYPGDDIILGFLRILRFLGRFIRAREAEADAVSIRLLLFIYDDLESVILSKTLTLDARRAMLVEDIKKYKSWVETVDLVSRGNEPAGIEPRVEAAEKDHKKSDTLDDIKDLTPHEIVAYALDDLKKTITAEFGALRAELRLWRERSWATDRDPDGEK